MNYLLAVFVGFVALHAAYDKFGTQGLVILGVSLLIGVTCIYKAFALDGKKETRGQASIMAWLGYIFTVPAAVTLIGGLIEEFSGSR